MENIVNEIKQNVCTDFGDVTFYDVTEYRELVYKKEISVNAEEGKRNITASVWTEAIQKALDEKGSVIIPDVGEDIYIDKTLIMHTGCKLKAAKTQRIVLVPDAGVMMLRNENVYSGVKSKTIHENPDLNILVEGGIWDCMEYSREITNGNQRLWYDTEKSIQGVLAQMLFSNVEDIILKNITFTNSKSYAVQISNCKGFYINNIHFENYYKDGIHINGEASYGIVSDMFGKNMGDDMVAFNAWDWDTSAMSFGTIEKLLVENIHSEHNEFRLLPGRKSYADGTYNDCDIRNCVIRNVEGVYTFKLYGQPNVHRVEDCSEILGRIENVYFDNITFPEITQSGFANLPVKGLFEVCSDTNNLYFNDIKIKNTAAEIIEKGINVIKAGPLSATWTNGSDDPKKWTEVFYPDDICTMNNTHIGKIKFADRLADEADKDVIIKAIKLEINEDYPNTTPKGGTGYGIINEVLFE